MATYTELAAITNDSGWSGLMEKIQVAIVIKAVAIIDSTTPAASLLEWAKSAVANPGSAAQSIAYYVVGANSTATLSQITGASDTAVQNNVNDAVDALYGV